MKNVISRLADSRTRQGSVLMMVLRSINLLMILLVRCPRQGQVGCGQACAKHAFQCSRSYKCLLGVAADTFEGCDHPSLFPKSSMYPMKEVSFLQEE